MQDSEDREYELNKYVRFTGRCALDTEHSAVWRHQSIKLNEQTLANMTGGENYTNFNHKFEEEKLFASSRFLYMLSIA